MLLQWFLLLVKFTGYIELTYGGNTTFYFIFQLC